MIPVLHGVWAAAGGLVGDFEHIETVTVGAGGTSSVSFSSIASTYKHLQIRSMVMTNRGTYGIDGMRMRFNSDSGSNYARHRVYGNGATPTSSADTTQTYIGLDDIGTTVSSYPGACVIDLLDYASTSKYKTSRALCGVDLNGTIAGFPGTIQFTSGLWMSTSAVNAITFTPVTGTLFAQYTTFALYGVK